MIGVGAEQNYVLAGWARPQVLVLMDCDADMVQLHEAYRACFELAAKPDEFIALWKSADQSFISLDLRNKIRPSWVADR